jgi:hypothetical protein
MDPLLWSSPCPPPPPIPPWIVNRLAHHDLNRIDLNRHPLAMCFQHRANEDTAKSRTILGEVDQVEDELGIDDSVLDGLVVELTA